MIDQTTLKSIEDLHRLKNEGVITEEEFERSKEKLLFGSKPASQPRPAVNPFGAPPTALPAVEDHKGWILLPLKRYADFTGRSTRREFWMFQLIYLALFVVGFLVIGGSADAYGETSALGGLMLAMIMLALLGLLVPLLAVEVRRFHDQDRSGWFVLLNLIPYVGVILVYGMMLVDGTRGDNRFGPDPKAS